MIVEQWKEIHKVASKICQDLYKDPCYNEDYADRVCIVKGGEVIYSQSRLIFSEIYNAIYSKNLIYKKLDVLPDHKRGINEIYIKAIRESYTFDELVELGYTFKEINKILKQQEKEV